MILEERARARVWACAAAVALAGCGQSASPPKPRLHASIFSYDAARPLRFADRGRVNHDYPIAVRDVSFTARGSRVRAFLVLPPERRRLPAVVYLHGSGGDRRELLVPATWLAARGAVALAITAPSRGASVAQGLSPLEQLRRQRDLAVGDVVAVRRAVDLLRSLPEVDPRRIGFVGWSAGARTGAIVAGVEPRIRAFVLMSGGAPPISAYLASTPAALKPDVARVLRQIDPIRYVALAAPGRLLLQDGRADEVVPRTALASLAEAAPKGTAVRWYDAGHALNAAAYRDQLTWLARKLAIQGKPVAGARAGP